MSRVHKPPMSLAIGILAFAFFMAANPVSYVLQGSWTSTAEAIVGRPATPVSVAGVARRSVRRCAVGVTC
jgi:hypothetical protein